MATRQEILAAPRFDMSTNADIGRLIYMGQDTLGYEVYILGLGAGHRHIKYAVDAALRLAGVPKSEYRLVNCLPCVNLATRLGGFTSRSLGIVKLGRPLVAWGVARSYRNYLHIVQKVRSSLNQQAAFLDWVPPL